MKPIAALFLLGLFILCPLAARANSITIADGKTIDVISSGPGDAANVLAVKYHSALALEDKTTLHIEADEVWNHFGPDADLGHYDHAILSAVGSDGAASDFFLQKTNGIWHWLDFKAGEEARLTVEMAKDFMGRADAAMDHDEMNAAPLYLGDNWIGTSHYKARGYASSSTANRTQMAEFTSHLAKHYKHSRNIYNVTVSDDGKSARIESYETESGALQDKSFSTVEHSLDNIAIENGSIVIEKSFSDVTVQGVPGFSSGNKHSITAQHIGSRAEFLRALALRAFPIGTVCMAEIFVWLILTRVQRRHLRALVNSGVRVRGVITSANIYNANARRGIVTGLDVAYRYLIEAGVPHHGRMRVFTSGSSDPASYATSASADIVYLARKPSISALSELMAAKNAALVATERKLLILAPVALLIALTSAWYLFR